MRLTVDLEGRAHEMAQEEIQKQVAYLSPDIRNVRFAADGASSSATCRTPRPHAARARRARARRSAAAQPETAAAQGALPQRGG